MTVTLPPEKLAEIIDLISSWLLKLMTTIKDLRSLMGKLLYVSQCCPLACLFMNRMLETLHTCPFHGCTALSDDFRKDLSWFHWYQSSTDGVFLIHKESMDTPASVHGCLYYRLQDSQNYPRISCRVSFPHPSTTPLHMPPGGSQCYDSSQGLSPHVCQAPGPPLFHQCHNHGHCPGRQRQRFFYPSLCQGDLAHL